MDGHAPLSATEVATLDALELDLVSDEDFAGTMVQLWDRPRRMRKLGRCGLMVGFVGLVLWMTMITVFLPAALVGISLVAVGGTAALIGFCRSGDLPLR